MPPRKKSTPKQALELAATEGLRGFTVPTSGLRDASFAHLRAGGAVYGGLPRIAFTPTGPRILDGRHRILLARERGERTIRAIVYIYGPRDGVLATREIDVPI